MKKLIDRRTKAEQLEFTELVKYLPQYLDICEQIYVDEHIKENDDITDAELSVAGLIINSLANRFGERYTRPLEVTIMDAVKDKNYVTIYSLHNLLCEKEMQQNDKS